MTPAELSRTVLATVRRAVAAEELRVAVPDRIVVQRPPRPGCGDYATNVALQLAGPAGRTPHQVAEILSRRLQREPGIAQVEIAGPGFLNITLDARAYGDVVRQVRAQRDEYGYGDGLAGEAVTVEGAPGDARGQLVAEVVDRLARAAGAPAAAKAERLAPARVPAGDMARAQAALGPDEIRWALLRPPAEDTPRPTPDLLVQRESNPLFRIRYAHARTRALLRNAADLGVEVDPHPHPHPHPHPDSAAGAADAPGASKAAATDGPGACSPLRNAMGGAAASAGPDAPAPRTPLHSAADGATTSAAVTSAAVTPAATSAATTVTAPVAPTPPRDAGGADPWSRHTYHHPAETELLGLLADFTRVIETAARRRAPDRLARHLERLADAYFRFQDECPALPKGDEKPSAVHAARIRLADATGIVLADGLRLLGITAPDHL